ncbi:MAG: beta-ketoacyl synthase N-terminal-like domain-containing protein [Flavitalea sp.]
MRAVYSIADNIISPLGTTTGENFQSLQKDKTGIRKFESGAMSPQPFHAALFESAANEELYPLGKPGYSLFERIMIHSVREALSQTNIDATSSRVIFIISSTKGNIAMIEKGDKYDHNEVSLAHSAKQVAGWFENPNEPVVVSNACISGVLGVLTAKRLIEANVYDVAVVTGADVITKFILSGFQSFQAVSPEPCRPFDASRQGVTLGEGAATMIIATDAFAGDEAIEIMGGATSNDANHISGPSRDGAPLFDAIQRSFDEAGVRSDDIGFISAHGTATIYNDEMEAKAISLAGMETVPVNSLKGYYGHTLGAAGLIESVITLESLRQNFVIPTKGFETLGVSKNINVCGAGTPKQMKYALKTASGFGGCNAAMVFGKTS